MGVGSPVHEKIGHTGQGLWKHKGWQLPAGIQHVTKDLMDKGRPESEAVRLAVGIVRNWSEGHDGKGNKVSAKTQAGAAKAIAEWDALRARAKAGAVKESPLLTGLRHSALVEATTACPSCEKSMPRAIFQKKDMCPHCGKALHPAVQEATRQFGGIYARQAGESAASWQARLHAPVAKTAPAKTSTASASSGKFNSLHPRGAKGSPGGGKFVAKGSSGTAVSTVQRHVGARATGRFDDATVRAVKAYQRKHGLVVDGVAGRQTLASLRGNRFAGKSVKTGALNSADHRFLASRK